jgi:hypothetical protein
MAFWTLEEVALADATSELVMLALLAGGRGGVDILPPGIQPLVDWEFFNKAALRYLREDRIAMVRGITETTRTDAVQAINDWLQSGEHLDSLRAELAPLFGTTRADMIAATEVTRAVAAGNEALWQSTGVISGKQWRTARDDRVCIICQPLDSQITELDSSFELTVDAVAGSDAMARLGLDEEAAMQRAMSVLGNVGRTHQRPPAHPRCRCWESPIVSTEMVREGRQARLGI